MNNSLRFAAFALLLAFAHQSKADTVLSVTNGSGGYAPNLLSFYDANGTQLVLDGGSGVVTITYPDSKVFSFPYSQTVAGLSVTGSWSGTDEWGYDYTATVQETLVQTRHGLSGRGGGYKTVTVTSVSGGKIIYDYAGAYAPPLIAPIVTGTSATTTATISWTSASGGVAPYSYSVFDQDGNVVAQTSGLAAAITGLSPSSVYEYTVVTTDSAGRQVSSSVAVIYTEAPTLETRFHYNLASDSVTATWSADPTAVSYSVFYYDWALGMWIDGADTTGTSATVSGWSPDSYVEFYIAAYDANGVETDYDQQLVSVQPPSVAPPRRDD